VTTLSFLVAIAIDVLFPVGLAIWVRRRFRISWRYLAMGAVVFAVSQLLTRIPAMKVLEYFIADELKASEGLLLDYLVAAAVTAGLFEEVGRYLGWRWLLRKQDKSFGGAVMYGVGHGGLESALLVGGLAVIGLLGTFYVPGLEADALGLTPEQADELREAQHQLATMPAWLPLMGGIERVFAICVQISLSVLVVQCFVRGSIKWLFIAIGYHAFVDFVAVMAQYAFKDPLGPHMSTVATEGFVAVLAVLSLVLILRLRPRRREGQ
jgi:uncharacterized membrane protein YhfC